MKTSTTFLFNSLVFLSLVMPTTGFGIMTTHPVASSVVGAFGVPRTASSPSSTTTQLKYSIVYPDDDSSNVKKEVPNETGSIGVHNTEDKPTGGSMTQQQQQQPQNGNAGGAAQASMKNADGAVSSFEGYKDFDESDPENAVYDYVDTAAYEKA